MIAYICTQYFFDMILNGLGFIDDHLYMHSAFLANKPVDRLFCADIEAHHFNDDALGRCIDATDYGPTKLFGEISFKLVQKFNLFGKIARFDTTLLMVYGDYQQACQQESPQLMSKQ